ncbi:hypothetical protein FNF31_01463 [Cafeteria roenbergensis]|uniref:Homeobox domain-containing protein n=1 Tax=Cafeteria roenbergensis TaxID=33653 RepID=A0A5A8DNN3_CAFRO|nr:hypothetical protein FNF31_01463 [Cafeteria roenbergensis]
MASESGPEEDSGVVAVFQGGVAQTGQCTFIAELNTTKPVHLGVANDLWDAIELFVAGLRHCQSMLRGDNTVTMDSVTRSLEDTVAHGGLQRAVEASLALQARAHKQAAHHRGPGGPTAAFTDPFGASRRPAFSRPAVAASFGGAMASYSLANASGAEEGGWGSTPGHGALASDGMGLPALDGMHSDLSDGGGGPLGLDPSTGRSVVCFGVPEGYMDVQNYDEKTSGRLPADTTKALKQWMVDHWSSPYPQEAEKATMAGESGMTLQQVSNWFRNERKRIWLPLKRRAEQLLAPELAERKRA